MLMISIQKSGFGWFFQIIEGIARKMFLKVFKKFELFCDLKDIQKNTIWTRLWLWKDEKTRFLVDFRFKLSKMSCVYVEVFTISSSSTFESGDVGEAHTQGEFPI